MRSSGGGGGSRKKLQAVSTSTMGRALLLLSIATTSTNAFTSYSPFAISTTTIHHQSNSALKYRYGNDNSQPSIDMKQFNINSAAAMHRRRRSHHMSSSRRLSKPTTNTPLPSPPTQPPTIELEQEMDEYIEYLDRRYTRMHPKRSPSIVYKYFNLQGKILSSLLPSPTTSSGSSNNKDHTIKILGLSGLASKRLRQRLHVVSATTTSSRRRTSKKAVSTTRSSRSSSSAIVMRPQHEAISDKIISSIRSICNFFSLNIIPELLVNKAGGFSMASLAMLLLIRPLLSTFRQS